MVVPSSQPPDMMGRLAALYAAATGSIAITGIANARTESSLRMIVTFNKEFILTGEMKFLQCIPIIITQFYYKVKCFFDKSSETMKFIFTKNY
jgi:hypothetical protein